LIEEEVLVQGVSSSILLAAWKAGEIFLKEEQQFP
jgi:hypothetical protein